MAEPEEPTKSTPEEPKAEESTPTPAPAASQEDEKAPAPKSQEAEEAPAAKSQESEKAPVQAAIQALPATNNSRAATGIVETTGTQGRRFMNRCSMSHRNCHPKLTRQPPTSGHSSRCR